jgi:hypothetical protein
MIAPFLDIDRDERPEKNLSVRKIGPVGSTCCSYALIASHAQRCRVLRRLQRETKTASPYVFGPIWQTSRACWQIKFRIFVMRITYPGSNSAYERYAVWFLSGRKIREVKMKAVFAVLLVTVVFTSAKESATRSVDSNSDGRIVVAQRFCPKGRC